MILCVRARSAYFAKEGAIASGCKGSAMSADWSPPSPRPMKWKASENSRDPLPVLSPRRRAAHHLVVGLAILRAAHLSYAYDQAFHPKRGTRVSQDFPWALHNYDATNRRLRRRDTLALAWAHAQRLCCAPFLFVFVSSSLHRPSRHTVTLPQHAHAQHSQHCISVSRIYRLVSRQTKTRHSLCPHIDTLTYYNTLCPGSRTSLQVPVHRSTVPQ